MKTSCEEHYAETLKTFPSNGFPNAERSDAGDKVPLRP